MHLPAESNYFDYCSLYTCCCNSYCSPIEVDKVQLYMLTTVYSILSVFFRFIIAHYVIHKYSFHLDKHHPYCSIACPSKLLKLLMLHGLYLPWQQILVNEMQLQDKWCPPVVSKIYCQFQPLTSTGSD